ncbi:Crp/Fnr family transcriptional regulator [Roseicella aquatilis]|nr:Crp/Fnr family transcriptional regulator [Roseicella aquatilis]
MDRAEAERIVLSKGWLAAQPPAFQAALFRESGLLRFRKGETVYLSGSGPGGLYGVVQGSFGTYVSTRFSGPDLSHILRPGWWFGEGPTLGSETRLIGVRAMEASFALHLPLAAGRALVRDPDAARSVSEISRLGMQVAVMNVSELLIRRVDRRLGAVLLRVSGAAENGVLRPTGDVRLTQGDLARMANASRDLVNRMLARFEAAGWVRLGYNRIAILDPEATARFAYQREWHRVAVPCAAIDAAEPGCPAAAMAG